MPSEGFGTTVRHVDKTHVQITPAMGWRVVIFNLAHGSIEAIVTADDGDETIRLIVDGPNPNQNISIETDPDNGVVDIIYTEKPSAV